MERQISYGGKPYEIIITPHALHRINQRDIAGTEIIFDGVSDCIKNITNLRNKEEFVIYLKDLGIWMGLKIDEHDVIVKTTWFGPNFKLRTPTQKVFEVDIRGNVIQKTALQYM